MFREKSTSVKNTRVKVISRKEKSHDDLCGLGLIGVDSHNEEVQRFPFAVKPANSWML